MYFFLVLLLIGNVAGRARPTTNVHGQPIRFVHRLDDGQLHSVNIVDNRMEESPISPRVREEPIVVNVEAERAALHARVKNITKPWGGGFEIHVFQVGQGDSQLIIFPSGYTILIDVAEASWNTNKGAELVAAKVVAILGHNRVDVGTPSHLHLDHMGYAGYGGFWWLIENNLITFGKIVDRDAGVWKGDGYNNGTVNEDCDPAEIEWHNVGTIGGTAERWVCYVSDPRNTKVFPIYEIAKMSSTTQVQPPDKNAKVTVLLLDAVGVKQVDGVPVSGDRVNQKNPPSENDYCIGYLIQFGSFSYVTAGDTDGEYTTSPFGYSYNDVEDVLKDIVTATVGHQIDVLHANHHGSSHSSSTDFINTMHPQASFISCGLNNAHGHPAQESLDRLLAVGDVYLPNICDPERSYGKSVIVDGDIVLYSDTGATFTIENNSYKSRGPSNPPSTPKSAVSS